MEVEENIASRQCYFDRPFPVSESAKSSASWESEMNLKWPPSAMSVWGQS